MEAGTHDVSCLIRSTVGIGVRMQFTVEDCGGEPDTGILMSLMNGTQTDRIAH